MGRQWNQIIESLGPLSGGTGLSINANLTEIEALLTTLQADIVDGIIVSSGSSVVTNGTLAQLTNGTVAANVEAGSGSFFGDGNSDLSMTLTNSILSVNLKDPDNGQNPIGVATNPLPISGTVTANPTYATSGGTGPTTFTSTSYGTIAVSNANRKGLTVFNEGAGNLHITIGTATTSTSSYTIRLATGDYYELPYNYTGLIGGIFATAGTARVTEIT